MNTTFNVDGLLFNINIQIMLSSFKGTWKHVLSRLGGKLVAMLGIFRYKINQQKLDFTTLTHEAINKKINLKFKKCDTQNRRLFKIITNK